jgi:hypothetical protein
MNNSPMHTMKSTVTSYDEENELESDIEHLERRLASAKSQLMFVACQKAKQFKS